MTDKADPTDRFIIACAAWNNVTPEQMADVFNKSDGVRIPDNTRKAWGRVFAAIEEDMKR